MNNSSFFQIVLLSLFGLAIVVGVMVFAGVLPGWRAPSGGTLGTVTLWGSFSPSSLEDFLNDFNEAHEDTLTLEYEWHAPATLETDLLQALATDTGPDLVILPSELLYRQGDKLFVIPATSFSTRDFKNTFVTAGEIFLLPNDSGTAALPLLVDPLVMYYNRSILQSAAIAEVPTTWTAFRAALDKINVVDNRGNITRTGIAAGEFSNYDNAKDLLSLLFLQAGTPIVSFDGERYQSVLAENFGYSLSPGQASLDFFTQFVNPSKTSYSWNRSQPEAKDALAAGILATYFGFASEEAAVRAKNPNLDLDVAIVPQRGSGERLTAAKVYGVAILQAGDNLAGAAQAAGLLSAADSVAALSAVTGLPPARRDLLSAGTTDSFDQVYFDSALLGRTWLDPDPAQTKRIWTSMTERVTTGQSLSLDSINRASQELQAIFK